MKKCPTEPKPQWGNVKTHLNLHLDHKPLACELNHKQQRSFVPPESVGYPCSFRTGDPSRLSGHYKHYHKCSKSEVKMMKRTQADHAEAPTAILPRLFYYPSPSQCGLSLPVPQISGSIPPLHTTFPIPVMNASHHQMLQDAALVQTPDTSTTIIPIQGTPTVYSVPIHAPMSGAAAPFMNPLVEKAPVDRMLHGPATTTPNARSLTAGPPAQGFLPSIVAHVTTSMPAGPSLPLDIVMQPAAPPHTLDDQPNSSLMTVQVARVLSASLSPVTLPVNNLHAPNTSAMPSPRSAPLSPVAVQVITLPRTNLIREDASLFCDSSGPPTSASHTSEGTPQETSRSSTPQNSIAHEFPVSDLRATTHEGSQVAESPAPPQGPRGLHAPAGTDVALYQTQSHGEPIRREKSTRQARAAPYSACDKALPAGRKAPTGVSRQDSNLARLWSDHESMHRFTGVPSSGAAHETYTGSWRAESPEAGLTPYADPTPQDDPFMPSHAELPSRRNSAPTQHGSQSLLESPCTGIFREPTPPLGLSGAESWMHMSQSSLNLDGMF